MLGALVGDAIGSPYEGKLAEEIDASAPLFTEMNRFTDDTVLTIATATALRTGSDMAKTLKAYTIRYSGVPYGGLFLLWACTNGDKPYGSHGLGAPMRVSPAAYFATDEQEARRLAQQCAAVTHDSPIAMAACASLAAALYRARMGASPGEVSALLRREMESWLDGKPFADPATIWGPQRCAAALMLVAHHLREAHNFPDLMLRLRALGGDTDTLCSIGGALAEPLWGIPVALLRETEALLAPELWTEARRFHSSYGRIAA